MSLLMSIGLSLAMSAAQKNSETSPATTPKVESFFSKITAAFFKFIGLLGPQSLTNSHPDVLKPRTFTEETSPKPVKKLTKEQIEKQKKYDQEKAQFDESEEQRCSANLLLKELSRENLPHPAFIGLTPTAPIPLPGGEDQEILQDSGGSARDIAVRKAKDFEVIDHDTRYPSINLDFRPRFDQALYEQSQKLNKASEVRFVGLKHQMNELLNQRSKLTEDLLDLSETQKEQRKILSNQIDELNKSLVNVYKEILSKYKHQIENNSIQIMSGHIALFSEATITYQASGDLSKDAAKKATVSGQVRKVFDGLLESSKLVQEKSELDRQLALRIAKNGSGEYQKLTPIEKGQVDDLIAHLEFPK